jgi:hypothetical protein
MKYAHVLPWSLLCLMSCAEADRTFARAFRLTSQVRSTDEGSPSRAHETWLTLDEAAGTATLSANGTVVEGSYSTAGSSLSISFPDEVPTIFNALVVHPSRCEPALLQYHTLHLKGRDTDNDGVLDALTGRMTGFESQRSTDSIAESDVVGSVAGTKDEAGSPLAVGSTNDVHPLDLLVVRAEEPIAARVLDILDADGGTVVRSGAFVGANSAPEMNTTFSYIPGAPLAWGTDFEVHARSGEGLDVDGHESGVVSFSVLPAPAAFDTWDFEGTVNGIFRDGAGLVLDTSVYVPAREGQAVHLYGDGSFTARFETTNATELVVRLRYLGSSFAPINVAIDFFEGESRHYVSMSAPSPLVWSHSGGGESEIVEVRVPLPSFALDGDFAVRLANPLLACPTVPIAKHSAVLEGLRVE